MSAEALFLEGGSIHDRFLLLVIGFVAALNYFWLQGRLEEANRFYIALAHGSFSPATTTAECTAMLMRAHLQHGDPEGAARIFQNLPHLPVRPALSAGVVTAAAEALCLSTNRIPVSAISNVHYCCNAAA